MLIYGHEVKVNRGSVYMGLAYKLFVVNKRRPGELFPLYVNATQSIPLGVWLQAESGERVEDKVKSKLGLLAYRPAWHLCDLPIATHIGVKDATGKIKYIKENTVWCLCEYADIINYQDKANARGMINGKFVPKKAYLDYIPVNGYYRYKTNPNMFNDWILSGAMRVLRVMTDEEVNYILRANNIQPMERVGGPIKLEAYGFKRVS